LAPSLTFGYGLWDGNVISENIDVKHLLNIKYIRKRKENMKLDKVHFKYDQLVLV